MGRFIDITGERFGKLVAEERVGTSKNGHPLWRVHCDCGREKVLPRNRLYQDRSCGCAHHWDLTGKRFGRLLVLGLSGRNASGNLRWTCKCDCGEEKIITGSQLSAQSRGTKSCGCLRVEALRLHPGADAVRLPKGLASRNAVLRDRKEKARRSGRVWKLSDEEFDRICSSNCHYCGAGPSNFSCNPNNNGGFRYNGIDRLDSEEGYLNGNVVPCCWTCNWMKRSLSPEQFLGHVQRIQAYQEKRTTLCFDEAPK